MAEQLEHEVDELRIDASPQKAFFVHTLIRDIPLENAILDLVDNAVDGAKRIRPNGKYSGLEVALVLSPERFWIKDNCGGISYEIAHKYAFQFGRSGEFKPLKHSIGQFGVGMKRALFKLGNDFAVKSTSDKDRFVLEVNVPTWLADGAWEFRLKTLDSRKFAKPAHGTEIVVKNLHEEPKERFGQDWFLDKLRRQIRVAQQHFMRNGLVIKFNGKPIPAEPWKLKATKDLQPFAKTYTDRIKKGKVTTRLYAGVGESVPSDAGWYIFCNGRCVLERDQSPVTGWGKRFQGDDGSTNPKFHNQFSRFRGYAFLDSDDASLLPWDSTKASLDEGSVAFRLLRGRLVDAMRGVIDFLNSLDAEQELDDKEKTITPVVKAAPLKAIDDLGQNSEFRFVARKKSGPTYVSISYRRPQSEVHDMKEKLGVISNKEVGVKSFEYTYDRILGK